VVFSVLVISAGALAGGAIGLGLPLAGPEIRDPHEAWRREELGQRPEPGEDKSFPELLLFKFALLLGASVGMLVATPALLLSFRVLDLWRRLGIPDPRRLLIADRRDPVLYLRSFVRDDDEASPLKESEHLFGLRRSHEEKVVAALAQIGPVIAVGRPGEVLPPLGASRAYFEEDTWEADVRDLISRARLVVFRPGRTPGLERELRMVLSGDLRTHVFLITRDTDDVDDIRRFNCLIAEVLERENEDVQRGHVTVIAPGGEVRLRATLDEAITLCGFPLSRRGRHWTLRWLTPLNVFTVLWGVSLAVAMFTELTSRRDAKTEHAPALAEVAEHIEAQLSGRIATWTAPSFLHLRFSVAGLAQEDWDCLRRASAIAWAEGRGQLAHWPSVRPRLEALLRALRDGHAAKVKEACAAVLATPRDR
jgi:hypothetical protein